MNDAGLCSHNRSNLGPISSDHTQQFGRIHAPICPLLPDSPCDILEEIPTSLLIDCYQRDLGLDVSTEFEEIQTIQLCHGLESNLTFFHPAIIGSQTFYQQLESFDWYSPKNKFEYALAAQWIQPGDQVLDVGCGIGHFAHQIPHAHYVGLRPQGLPIPTPRERKGTCFTEHLIDHAAAQTEWYDAVCAFQVLEHVANPVLFTENLRRCLKPGGILVLGVPSAESYLTQLINFALNAPPHHVTWWTDQALRCLATQCDLEVLRLDHAPVEPWELRLYWMQRLSSAMTKSSKTHFTTSVSQRLLNISAYLTAGILETLRSAPSGTHGASVVLIARK